MGKFSQIVTESNPWPGKWPKWETLADGTIRYEDDISIVFTKGKKLHRVGGPAAVYKDSGIELWYLDGKRHRTDGPADINHRSGRVEYWINGKELTREEFEKHFGDD